MTNTSKEPNDRGGSRPGAGRPKGSPTRPVAFRLKEEEAVQLEALARPGESLAELCRRLLQEAVRTHPPHPPPGGTILTCLFCHQPFYPYHKRNWCSRCGEPLAPIKI